jgi:hypothetical protein
VLEALWFSVDWRILTVQGICNFQVSETSQSGWWFQPSEKYESHWDDEIPNIWKNNPNVPNLQPAMVS